METMTELLDDLVTWDFALLQELGIRNQEDDDTERTDETEAGPS